MATAGTGALGTHRLSVRNGGEPVTRPDSAQSQFAAKLNFENLAMADEPVYRSVDKGESRRVETVADGIEAFDEYVANKENATLVLQDRESGDVKVLPYNHRWTEEYRKMLYAKLKAAERGLDLIFGEGPTPVTLVTLTAKQTNDRGEPRPPANVLNDLQEGWNKFRRALDRATEGHKTEYLRIIEPHESGYPHIHVAVFGVAMPSLESTVQDLWVEKYGVGGESAHRESVEVARGRSAQLENVASYMMKYLGKTTVRGTGEQQQKEGYRAFAAMLWATGARQYSVSEGLSMAMSGSRDGSEGDWRFVGVVSGLEPGLYQGETAGAVLEHINSGWKDPPPDATPGPVQQSLETSI